MTVTPPELSIDQRVFLHDVSWEGYERILEIRGESSGVRISYLEGQLEFMSPSIDHERIKTTIARLLEAWCEECGPDLNGYGSWTVKREDVERGFEADECYILGCDVKERPDIAIEVVWTHGGIDKLEIYRKLDVPEVWMWDQGKIVVHHLRGEAYVTATRSELLPDLDLGALVSFLDTENQTQAVRDYRARIRGDGHKS